MLLVLLLDVLSWARPRSCLLITILLRRCIVSYCTCVPPYSGFKAVSLELANVNHTTILEQPLANGAIFWKEPRLSDSSCVLLVPPHLWTDLAARLRSMPISYDVLSSDVGKSFQLENACRKTKARSSRDVNNAFLFNVNEYHRLDEVNAYLASLVQQYPQLCQLETIGYSFEGRPMQILKISTNSTSRKPGIFIDAAMHPREWITTASLLHFTQKLLTGEDTWSRYFRENFAFYLLPIANPDGYDYTWMVDRVWRKNRSLHPGSQCYGTDLNRNFDYHWGERTAASSLHGCSSFFYGVAPLSEVETRSVANYLIAHNNSIHVYLSLHSYGQMILYPYSNARNVVPADMLQIALAREVGKAMQEVRGTVYDIGTSADLLYPASGVSMDWVLFRTGIPYAITIELPPNRTSVYQFALPPIEIAPISDELAAAIRVLAAYAVRRS